MCMSASVCLSRTLRSPSLFCVAPVCMIYIVRFEAIEQEGFRATKCLRVCFCHTYLRKAARSLIYPTSVIVASTPHTIHTHTHTPSLSLSLLSLSLPLCPSAPGPLHEHDDLTPYLFLGGELGPCFLLSLLHLNIDFGAEKHCG